MENSKFKLTHFQSEQSVGDDGLAHYSESPTNAQFKNGEEEGKGKGKKANSHFASFSGT